MYRAPTRTLSATSPAIPEHLGEPVLQALRLEGREGINSLFDYRLHLRTLADFRAIAHGTAAWDLDSFIGQPVCCRIEIDGSDHLSSWDGYVRSSFGAGVREINGIVSAAELWGDDGEQAEYRLTLRPALFQATLTTDCRIFQNLRIGEILDQVLRRHPGAVEWQLSRELPLRDYQTQYNETDFAFFERLCQEWGINYYFRHAGGRHTLVVTDVGGFGPFPAPAYQRIAFRAPGWKADAEYLHRLTVGQQLVTGRYETDDHDYTQPRAQLATSARAGRPARPTAGTVYEWHGGPIASHYAQPRAYLGPHDGDARREALDRATAEGRLLAERRLEALHTAAGRMQASGNLRALVPGCSFELAGHPRAQVNTAWLVLDTHFVLEELPQESQRPGADARPRWRVQVELTAHPLSQPLRPAPTRAKPFTHGPQSAVVSGPPGYPVWTDALGRIKVKFRWHRPEPRPDGATGSTSCWVRVASTWAGGAMGQVALPRVGQEVLIDFLGGDPDLPVCVGSLFHNAHRQPWELPHQHALSGLRSRELPQHGTPDAGAGGNQVVFDDTPGALQAQFGSDHRLSQLSLGRIHRILHRKGRQEARGEGFELRTDGHGALRAGDGLLISTHKRQEAAGGMKELQETGRSLAAAQAQLEAHALGAQDLGAQDTGDQQAVAAAIARQNAAIGGASSQPLGELSAPDLVMASAAGIAASAAQGLHLAAGDDIGLTSAAHTSLSTGGSLLASAAKAIRLLAHRGMRLFAAQGDVEVQAQGGDLRLTAKHTAELGSTDGWVQVTAAKGIRLNVGGTCIEITAAQIALLTEGRIALHSAGQESHGPRSRAAHLNRMPATAFDDRYVVYDEHHRPMPDTRLEVLRESGDVLGENSDAEGRIATQRSDAPDGIVLRTL